MKRIPDSRIWVPDGETHLLGVNRSGKSIWQNYQVDILEAAIDNTPQKRLAIDVGAHVGLMTRLLSEIFEQVISFEPHPDSFECLERNTEHLTNVTRLQLALGKKRGMTSLDSAEVVKGNTGNRQLCSGNDIQIVSLDELYADLQYIDLIKLDIQGGEYAALRGARELITRFHPTIMIEAEPKGKLRRRLAKEGAALTLLKEWGAVEVARYGADHVFVWKDPQ